MKILILSPRLNITGGVSNFTKIFISYLSTDYKLVFRGSSNNDYFGPIGKTFRFCFDYFVFLGTLILWRPKVVFLNISFSKQSVYREFIYVFISKLFNKKVVVFWHGWNLDYEAQVDQNSNHFFRKWFKNIDLAFCLSQRFVDKLSQWGFQYPILKTFTMISNADVAEGDQEFNSHELDHNTGFKFLWIGRMEEKKGLFEAIEIVEELNKREIKASLIICGDGLLKAKLVDYLSEINKPYIAYKGLVFGEEKAKVFRDSNALLFPSFNPEGMPTVIIEAIAYGLVVFTSPVGGIPDFFKKEMGVMFSVNSISSMVDEIIKYSETADRLQTSSHNKKFARENLFASVRVEFIEREIRKIC